MAYSHMSETKRNKKEALLLPILAILAGAVACIGGGEASDEDAATYVNGSVFDESHFDATRADLAGDAEDALCVNLSTTSEYVISDAGDYLLSGDMRGQIVVDAEEQIVHIILDGVSVTSVNGPAILVQSAGKVIITVAEGTENILSDSGQYVGYSEENACIYSNCDLTFNGSGSLTVYGYYKDAIHSKDVVKLLGPELKLYAERDGVRGNDGIWINDGRITAECDGAGLHTTKSGEDDDKGCLEISGGEVVISAGTYGLSSAADMYISNCHVSISGAAVEYAADGSAYVQEGCIQQ